MRSAPIARTVKDFIFEQFLPGEDSASLTDATPLITGGVLDSIATIRLVTFLEEHYAVRFEAHEMSADYLNTIDLIAATVNSKLRA